MADFSHNNTSRQEGERDVEAVDTFKVCVPKLELLYGEDHEYSVRARDNLNFLCKG